MLNKMNMWCSEWRKKKLVCKKLVNYGYEEVRIVFQQVKEK